LHYPYYHFVDAQLSSHALWQNAITYMWFSVG